MKKSERIWKRSIWMLAGVLVLIYSGAVFGDFYVIPTIKQKYAPVPKTGLTTCYNLTGSGIDCAGTGQDGEHQEGVASPTPRFKDKGDGTVKDNLTGLIWLKKANLIGTDHPGFDTNSVWGDGKVSWQQALDFVAGMNAGTYTNFGYTDWRLPNRNELNSLVDCSQTDPSLPSGHPFSDVQSSYYWSGTSSVYLYDVGWCVYMLYGSVVNHIKTDPHYVWSVRSDN